MDPILGQIAIFPFWTPQGWLPCEGQLLKVSDYQALFSLLGNKFGGDGRLTFALPNLKAAAETLGDGLHYAMAVEGIYPSRP
ncbi:phage tail protein [Nocardia sp. NPDC060259]|uniref:phage tail protein n=1 Tax=Nocardia sp. NPDC060259 TaxID=3347088 RepID=UPI0036673A98